MLQERWRHPASTVRRLSVTAAMLVFVTDGDDEELLHRQVRWAHLYDGYQRLASPPDALHALIDSAQREWEHTGRIPDWCGVDFLRGWAFYITRADRHGGGNGLAPGGSMLAEWRAVLRAITIHPGAHGEDFPPTEVRPTVPDTRLASAPRSHADPAVVALKTSRLFEPHIAPVNHFVLELAADRRSGIPSVDPDSGGVNARVLMLLEAPGRAAAHGSGMISADNDDPTAANVWSAYAKTGLSRTAAMHWNAVPWYVGTTASLGKPSAADLTAGRQALQRLIGMLPDLRVVIAMGATARRSVAPLRADLEQRGLVVIECDHPSARRYNLTRGAAEASVLAAFTKARNLVQEGDRGGP